MLDTLDKFVTFIIVLVPVEKILVILFRRFFMPQPALKFASACGR
jgi:hypothetical protein